MGQNNACELIVCIVNRGFCDLVMETARGAGARGGTVLHARGGGQVGQEFFGITIQPEKELLMILVKAEIKGGVMQAILKHAGPATPAHGICFSVPVDDTIGIAE